MGDRLQGKVALISGGARGQGAAEARLFVEEGASVVFGDKLDDQGKALADEIGDGCRYVHLDVAEEDDWKEAVRLAVDTFGGLNILINNAGIIPPIRSIVETPPEDYRRAIEINQVGMFLGIHTAVPAMTATEGSGSIVMISSVNGLVGGYGVSGYVSSKFAVRGLTKVAAIELARQGIRVNSVHPGGIDTAMLEPGPGLPDFRKMMAKAMPLGRLGSSEEVAELVCWLSSDAASYCTGSEFTIDGGFLAGPFNV
jgi:3alpha(or 20beta)-hydroxysteroid dehydrogenase